MFSYYDTEFQPELKQAEVDRGLARGALADEAVTVALAARLAPAGGAAPLPGRATRPTAWR